MLLDYWLKLPPWYNWNIVESGIKHHSPYPRLKLELGNLKVEKKMFFRVPVFMKEKKS
jgi:hypothetical protein